MGFTKTVLTHTNHCERESQGTWASRWDLVQSVLRQSCDRLHPRDLQSLAPICFKARLLLSDRSCFLSNALRTSWRQIRTDYLDLRGQDQPGPIFPCSWFLVLPVYFRYSDLTRLTPPGCYYCGYQSSALHPRSRAPITKIRRDPVENNCGGHSCVLMWAAAQMTDW